MLITISVGEKKIVWGWFSSRSEIELTAAVTRISGRQAEVRVPSAVGAASVIQEEASDTATTEVIAPLRLRGPAPHENGAIEPWTADGASLTATYGDQLTKGWQVKGNEYR